MRTLGLTMLALIVVIAVGLVLFAATFDVNQYHATIQSQLEEHLGRSVRLGDMNLGIFPPRFRVQNPAIADDPSFRSETPFVKAQELAVSVQLLPLLHKQIEISSLEMQRPSVNLIKNQAGVWNFASIGHPAETATTAEETAPAKRAPTSKPSPTPTPTSTPSPAQERLSLARLTINDGQISVLDQKESKTPTLYDHIDVTLKNFSSNTPFSVDAAVHMSGAGAQEARLRGEGGPIVEAQPATTPFRGTLSLKQVSVGDLAKFLNSPAVQGTDGTVSGETKIQCESGKLTAQGETNIQNAKVRGMELGYPISAQYDLTNDLASDLLIVRSLLVKLGSTPLQMSGTVNSKSTPAILDVDLKANNISIAEAAKLAASSGVALSQGTNVTGNLTANLHARGPADKPELNGTVNAANVQMSGRDIAQPVQVPSLNLNLTSSTVQSSPFKVISGGTTLDAQMTLQNYQSARPLFNATVRAPNAQLPAVLAMAKAYGVTSLDKVSGQGTLNLDMRASGPVKSVSTAELTRALNGTLKLNLNSVKYTATNVSHQLAAIAGFLRSDVSQSGQGVTNISKMTGDVIVKNGIAQTNNMQATLDLGNVGVAGTASLVDETLNLRVTAVLSQANSQKVGGTNVGGYLQTALANNQGELVVPALVTGTFSNPKFSPDVQQIAQMKIKGLIPGLQNPSAVTGTLQKLLGGPAQQNQQQQPGQQPQTQQQNPVDQILGIFGKKKKSNPPPPQ